MAKNEKKSFPAGMDQNEIRRAQKRKQKAAAGRGRTDKMTGFSMSSATLARKKFDSKQQQDMTAFKQAEETYKARKLQEKVNKITKGFVISVPEPTSPAYDDAVADIAYWNRFVRDNKGFDKHSLTDRKVVYGPIKMIARYKVAKVA